MLPAVDNMELPMDDKILLPVIIDSPIASARWATPSEII